MGKFRKLELNYHDCLTKREALNFGLSYQEVKEAKVERNHDSTVHVSNCQKARCIGWLPDLLVKTYMEGVETAEE